MKILHSFRFLIDQQASAEFFIKSMDPKKTAQPIVISSKAGSSDYDVEELRLTREQCVELVKGLKKALKHVPPLEKLTDISNSDYLGKLI